MARRAKAKREWLDERLGLPNGLPGHDTLAHVLARLDADAFHGCFVAWTRASHQRTDGEVLARDGEAVRASARAGLPALHRVSVWAAQSRLVLARRKARGHENGIVAVPGLLAVLERRGCLVTGDALLRQKGVAAQVMSQGEHCVRPLKESRPLLRGRVAEFFGYGGRHRWRTEGTREAVAHRFAQAVGKGHGRVETRRCWLVEAVGEWLDTGGEWARLCSAVCVQVCAGGAARHGDGQGIRADPVLP